MSARFIVDLSASLTLNVSARFYHKRVYNAELTLNVSARFIVDLSASITLNVSFVMNGWESDVVKKLVATADVSLNMPF